MTTRITLTIEQEILEQAKKYVDDKGQSLSDIIENYLESLSYKNSTNDIELTPLVKSLKGSFKSPENYHYQENLSDSLSEKYL